MLATLSRHDRVRSELERSLDPDAQAALGLLTTLMLPADDLRSSWHCRRERCYEVVQAGRGRPNLVADSAFCGSTPKVHSARSMSLADDELNRDVALKRMKDEPACDPNCRARFVREAEITGRLEHPGIVPVYGLGQFPDGRPEYAMRFIEGESLRAAIARHHAVGGDSAAAAARRLALPNLVRRFLDVCNAISYAHNRGVVHRDIKPANIMLGPYGETLVVDWGLAKSVGRPDEAAGRARDNVATVEPEW